MHDGSLYVGNLLLKNAAYYIYFIDEKAFFNSDMQNMYRQEKDDKEMPWEIYTPNIRLGLDILRLCVSFIRNISFLPIGKRRPYSAADSVSIVTMIWMR
jgi:hypothetical protein